MSLNNLKDDMLKLIDLSHEMGKYNEMLLYCSDMEDKKNYNEDKSNKIRIKIKELEGKFFELKDKWF